MNRKAASTLLALTLVSTLGLAPGAFADPETKDRLESPIDFKVTQADSGEVFRTFGQILGAEVTFDPALEGRKLTLALERVRLRTALGVACESLGCQWSYVEGKPAKLTFKARAARNAKSPEGGRKGGLDDEIDIHVTKANVVEVLRTAAQILSAEASLDPRIAGTLDLDLKGVPVRDVLNQICGKIHCSWTLVEGEKPVLQFTSLK